ncbi:MAG: SPFH domain-containing protein [Burkholderiaceae bacterium]
MDTLSELLSLIPRAAYVVAAVLVLAWLIRISGVIRYIPNSQVGIVEKIWSAQGSVETGLMALAGEAGYQPEVLRGGFHFFAPFQYRIHHVPLVTITQGQIGYVFARDGRPLSAGQTLASNDEAASFENVRVFLLAGGQKGPQRTILREGTYALNLAQFVVLTEGKLFALQLDASEEALFAQTGATLEERHGYTPLVIKDRDDLVGVVTIHDGPALPAGEIIAPAVGDAPGSAAFHNNFQDPDRFLKAGYRGRQYQVLVDGSYYLNRLFATVELIGKTVIPVGHAGVVVSYTGKQGRDVSGDAYRHGELVETGFRGVWATPLLPGKYAFNTYAGQVVLVPTTNFILKWSAEVTSEHKFDQNLKEVSLITKDAFEPSLPLSVVVHIDYMKAPLVVQRFGDIRRLVEQTLDPMVSAYFKNIAQTKTLIELLQERSDIQRLSSEDMKTKFAAYSLELQEVLIGTPRSSDRANGQIEEILRQLRERQIAIEQVATFELRERAAIQERTLREAEAKAAQQGDITRSLLSVEVRANEGRAAAAFAEQDARRIRIAAGAEAERLTLLGEGEAQRIAKVGGAEASATRLKVDAFGGPEYQLAQQVFERFADAIKAGGIPIVPQIQVGGSGDGTSAGGSLVDALLALVVREQGAGFAPRASSGLLRGASSRLEGGGVRGGAGLNGASSHGDSSGGST